MLTIKGSTKIIYGDGTLKNPYTFEDYKKVEGGEDVSKTSTGEYIIISDTLYRVIDNNDGLVKVISDDAITNGNNTVVFSPEINNNKINYNPQSKKSVGYFINNRIGDYVESKYFDNHSIKVPIYKGNIIYGEESTNKEYRAKMFAPNMYEMFSAQTNLYGHVSHSYWLLNTSKKDFTVAAITDIGVPINDEYIPFESFGVRVCSYLKKGIVVTSGSGTHEEPYMIK